MIYNFYFIEKIKMLVKAKNLKIGQYINYENIGIYLIKNLKYTSDVLLIDYYDKTLNQTSSLFVNPNEKFETSNYYFEKSEKVIIRPVTKTIPYVRLITPPLYSRRSKTYNNDTSPELMLFYS
jgi:hypothetical protein